MKEQLLSDSRGSLEQTVNRIENDLKFDEGKWNTTLYNSDPLTAYPNSSSQTPVYIVTSEGFVIERSKPISGLLDTSDFKHLTAFTTPQNINSLTNESWRVLSKPIKEGNVVGVVIVSYYNPEPELIEQIDKKLHENLEGIDSQIEIKDGEIDISKIDIRNTHYDVSFEVVTKYNKVLLNNGRTPSFIDPSYIQNEVQNAGFRIIQGNIPNQEYLIYTKTITDGSSVKGIVIAGESIDKINYLLQSYIVISFVIGVIFTFPMVLYITYFSKNSIRQLIGGGGIDHSAKNYMPAKIIFNYKEGYFLIDKEKYEIAKDTNQFYICKALLAHPKKIWANDELLEVLGENIDNSNPRKVYDSVLAINKKIDLKLIDYKDKTYFVNRKYVSLSSLSAS